MKRSTPEQLDNVCKMHLDDKVKLLDILIDDLGLCSADGLTEVMQVSPARPYQIANSENTRKIGKHLIFLTQKVFEK